MALGTGGIVLIVALVIGFLAIAGIGGYFLFKKGNNKEDSLDNKLSGGNNKSGNNTSTDPTKTGTNSGNKTSTDPTKNGNGSGNEDPINPEEPTNPVEEPTTCKTNCTNYYKKDANGCCLDECDNTKACSSADRHRTISNNCMCECKDTADKCEGGNEHGNWSLNLSCNCTCGLSESDCTSQGKILDSKNCKCINDPLSGYTKVGDFETKEQNGFIKTVNSSDPAKCKTECDKDNTCTGFTYSSASSKCNLYKWYRNLAKVKSQVSELYNKDAIPSYNDNVTYRPFTGGSIDTGNITNPEFKVNNKSECEDSCNKLNSCGGYLYNNTDAKCLLKHEMNRARFKGSSVWDSYIADRNIPNYTMIQSFEPDLEDLKLIQTDDPVLCSKECDKDSKCVGILTHPDNNGCRLKGMNTVPINDVYTHHIWRSRGYGLDGTFFMKDKNKSQSYTKRTNMFGGDAGTFADYPIDNVDDCKALCSASDNCKWFEVDKKPDPNHLVRCRLHDNTAPTGGNDQYWDMHVKN